MNVRALIGMCPFLSKVRVELLLTRSKSNEEIQSFFASIDNTSTLFQGPSVDEVTHNDDGVLTSNFSF